MALVVRAAYIFMSDIVVIWIRVEEGYEKSKPNILMINLAGRQNFSALLGDVDSLEVIMDKPKMRG
jgi:hypothetical protein